MTVRLVPECQVHDTVEVPGSSPVVPTTQALVRCNPPGLRRVLEASAWRLIHGGRVLAVAAAIEVQSDGALPVRMGVG